MVLRHVVMVLLLAWLGVCAGQAQELPVFDTHLHYNQPDWEVFPPATILAILDQAGVRRALVSSTPDDGTRQLYAAAPQRIVPFLRPYRSRADMGSWHSNPAVQAYVEERLTRGIYKGIGEWHLTAAQVDAPVLKRCAELAVQQPLFLHAHVDPDTMAKLLQQYPQVRFLWAHAGMSAAAATVAQLLEHAPQLWVELALRADVAPGDTLEPAWHALFLRYPERCMVGTDTWMTARWETLVAGMQTTRRWLAQLPQDIAAQLAYGNAERLFGTP